MGANAPTCDGPGVAAVAPYLLGRLHLPVQRSAEALPEAFGAAVSIRRLYSLLPQRGGGLDEFLGIARPNSPRRWSRTSARRLPPGA